MFGAKKSGSTIKPVYGGHTGHARHTIRIMGMPPIMFIMGIPAIPGWPSAGCVGVGAVVSLCEFDLD
jgi:hypothetical protein